MDSTGNKNDLRQESTVIEGAQIRVGNEDNQTPITVYLLLGVCCILQVLQFFYLMNCRTNLTMEMMIRDRAVEKQTEKTAKLAALGALDRYLNGKRFGFEEE